MEYALYLESGPRQKKTMVHVLNLTGCIARGATSAEALENTPPAIRAFLAFLHEHGEAVDPEAAFTTRVAQHVMEGSWLAEGDPIPGFAPDFEPLAPDELESGMRRLEWILAGLLETAHHTPAEKWDARPEKGRAVSAILAHVAEAQVYYLRYLVGKVPGLSEAHRAMQAGPAAVPAALLEIMEISRSRMQDLTEEERAMQVAHGQTTWTARRALRRMLEHAWEHYQELLARV